MSNKIPLKVLRRNELKRLILRIKTNRGAKTGQQKGGKMTKEVQAYIAHYAGQIIGKWSNSSVYDKDQIHTVTIPTTKSGFAVKNYPARCHCENNKSRDGINYCIINDEKDHHICLSIYGKLFDGYDHDSTSHFSGIVDESSVELYDYSKSDFFRFKRA